MKKLLFILIVLPLLITGCMATPPPSPPLQPLEIKLPSAPPDYFDVLNNIKLELGKAPIPVIIVKDNITYFGFTKEQMVQLRLFNEAFKQVEKMLVSQQQQAVIYFMQTKTLKELAEAQHAQAKQYRELYEATRSSIKRAELEALGYKILSFGSIIAIIAIAL